MQVIKTYIADDGTKFDSEESCLNYEQDLRKKAFLDSALLFDKDGEKLPLTEQGFESSFFIICKTTAAAEYLFETFGDIWDSPWLSTRNPQKGVWVFLDEWVPAKNIFETSDCVKKLMEDCGYSE